MKDLTQGPETRRIVGFAIPMLLGNVFQQLYSMIDAWVVGRFVGTEALAAVGTSFPVIFLMIALIMGVTMGSTILVAQFYGAKDFRRVRATVDTAYIFLFWTGLALTGIGIAATVPILRLLAVPPEIMPGATAFLRITFAGSLGMFGYNAVSSILRGLGDSKTPLYILIISTILNAALALLFVVVLGWGIAGSAWATVIAQGLSFIGAVAAMNKRNPHVRLSVKELSFDRELFRKTISIGLPSGVQQTLVAAGMMALARIVNAFGSETMAAYSIATRLDTFASMPAMNLSAAVSTFVGQNLGAGKPERVRRGHLSAVAVGAAISVTISAVVVLFGARLVSVFTPDPEVVRIGSRYLLIVGSSYVLFSTMFINNGVMRGAGDTMIPMLNTILALWLVRIPAATLFSGPLGMGSDGIWWSIPAGFAVGFAFSTWYYSTGKWKSKALVRGPAGGAAAPAGRPPAGADEAP